MATNLRHKQTAALNRMLNFNIPLVDGEGGGALNPAEWSDHVCISSFLHNPPLPSHF